MIRMGKPLPGYVSGSSRTETRPAPPEPHRRHSISASLRYNPAFSEESCPPLFRRSHWHPASGFPQRHFPYQNSKRWYNKSFKSKIIFLLILKLLDHGFKLYFFQSFSFKGIASYLFIVSLYIFPLFFPYSFCPLLVSFYYSTLGSIVKRFSSSSPCCSNLLCPP